MIVNLQLIRLANDEIAASASDPWDNYYRILTDDDTSEPSDRCFKFFISSSCTPNLIPIFVSYRKLTFSYLDSEFLKLFIEQTGCKWDYVTGVHTVLMLTFFPSDALAQEVTCTIGRQINMDIVHDP